MYVFLCYYFFGKNVAFVFDLWKGIFALCYAVVASNIAFLFDLNFKKLASLDIKSVYTNIPINKCQNFLKKYLNKSKYHHYRMIKS